MAKDDPTITRIREVRHQISAQCGHNSKKIVEYYIKLQEKKAMTSLREAVS